LRISAYFKKKEENTTRKKKKKKKEKSRQKQIEVIKLGGKLYQQRGGFDGYQIT
jgi:hypothetical protein